jgi:hypothetical protein
MNDCQRLGKLIGGCEFEARYDEEPCKPAGLEIDFKGPSGTLKQILTKRTYVHDICVTCGKIVKRESK